MTTSRNYLALDLGAESGRAIIGMINEGKLSLMKFIASVTAPCACLTVSTGMYCACGARSKQASHLLLRMERNLKALVSIPGALILPCLIKITRYYQILFIIVMPAQTAWWTKLSSACPAPRYLQIRAFSLCRSTRSINYWRCPCKNLLCLILRKLMFPFPIFLITGSVERSPTSSPMRQQLNVSIRANEIGQLLCWMP